MPTINEQIDKILDKRLGRGMYSGKGHLQTVEQKISKLVSIQNAVLTLKKKYATIKKDLDNKTGDFYSAFNSNPEANTAFSKLGPEFDVAVRDITTAIYELDKLKSRFKRDAVRIAFIGNERQGKSTFLRSMTRLPNEVIPAYDGTSCTGAVSVIHNSPEDTNFRAVIQFYSMEEMLSKIKHQLKRLFPKTYTSFSINSLEDLASLDLSGFDDDDKTELEGFKTIFINHKHCYEKFVGDGVKTYRDKDVVMTFVAQYREYEKREDVPSNAAPEDVVERVTKRNEDGTPKLRVWRHLYYKYPAVKSVDIYCRFPNQECGRMEFVDTVGLDSPFNSNEVEEEMFRVLLEDCDGAVDVFCPAPLGGTIPGKENSVYTKLKERLLVREPEKWLSYAINEIPSGKNSNIQNIPDILNILKTKHLPFGLIVPVNAKKEVDVNDKLLVPHLQMIVRNLSYLDNQLLDTVSVFIATAYNSCLSLLQDGRAAIPLSALSNWDFETDGYKPLIHDFNIKMNKLDHDNYAKHKDEPCEKLVNAYCEKIETIDSGLPSEDEIVDRFRSGNLITTRDMFEDIIEQMRNEIFDSFERINIDVLEPLQREVQLKIVSLMFKEGLWSRLPLPSEKSSKEPSFEWLENIIKKYVPETKYPSLFSAMRFILDYQISIEGLVEYNVTKSLHVIERTHKEFRPYIGDDPDEFEEKGAAVWQQLANRLLPVQKNLKSWINDFALIPSHSFYSRVHKFHIKIGTDIKGVQELKRFYYDNMNEIWHEEIAAKTKNSKAFNEWSISIENLNNLLNN